MLPPVYRISSTIWRISWVLPLTACAAPAPEASAPSQNASSAASPLAASAAAVSTASSAPTANPVASSPSAPSSSAGAALNLKFEQVFVGPVRSLALTDGARVAMLSDEPAVDNGKGFRELPLPAGLKPKSGQTDDVAIFFGRDYEPRIMGTRHASDGDRPVYLRHLNGAWRDGREEIGQLGSASRGDLWGELGTIDPELVCRTNAVCIIKRNSGWVTAPAGSVRRVAQLADGTVFGLDANGISGIDAKGWQLVIPAPTGVVPRAFWTSHGEAWLASEDALFHFAAGAWQKEPSPIAGPSAFAGADASAVWVVGQGGAALFDGRHWQLATLAGPLSTVAVRRGDDAWLGGAVGLFHAHP